MDVSIPAPSRLLAFWHQVEFFIPFNYEQHQTYHDRFQGERELTQPVSPDVFWRWKAPQGKVVAGFSLYLGLFSARQAENRIQEILEFGDLDTETEQRLPVRGTTSCMALLHLDEKGAPRWEHFSVSTFPWALAQLEKSPDPARLDFQAWLEAEDRLKALCAAFRKPHFIPEHGPAPLGPHEIMSLVELLESWCGSRPPGQDRDHRLIAIQPIFRERVNRDRPQSPPEESDDIKIDILNSFFAKDLARVAEQFHRHQPMGALDAYLQPVSPGSAINLYTLQGRKTIFEALWPASLPMGRWPAEDTHSLNLMQQFAVTTALEKLREKPGLFSVNGPPGTGKTTLLRDLIADVLVQRADILATFENASDVFEKHSVPLLASDGQERRLVKLHPDLRGHEILVVSSNNAAVENISRELPRADALGRSCWRDADGCPRLSYLRHVAANVAARKPNGEYQKLDADETPWGLMAAVLGRKSNRYRFKENLLFCSGSKADYSVKNYDPEQHQTLYEWLRRKRKECNFSNARRDFLQLKEKVETRRQERHWQVMYYCLRQSLERLEQQDKRIARHLELLQKTKPSVWSRWFTAQGRARWRQYRTERRELETRRQVLIRKQINLEKRLDGLVQEVGGEHKLQSLEQNLPTVSVPISREDLEEDHWQIEGLWRDQTLDHLRSEIFAAAMALHEAWLAEASSELMPNLLSLKELLDGSTRLNREQALILWQTLFMIVPVVSSTLASVATQFRQLKGGDLGWVLIDEAGQAQPQAVVGALWRAQRAVVVGDPLQIEPVFTVPPGLVDALMKANRIEPAQRVSPHQVSVQTLADAANPYGAFVGNEWGRQWIGTPLRVHRRCLDPMFSLANDIAYDGKMIQATADPNSMGVNGLELLPSSWVQLAGEATERQLVPAQIELVVMALDHWIQAVDKNPPLYLITPFRRIASRLREVLVATGVDNAWVERHVGTVHTFQGKENAVVWLVLGCDQRTAGAARWAAAKPNLLNVALTRARQRFYMIGDRALWGGLPHFTLVDEARLPTIDPQAFINQFVRGNNI